MATGSRYLKGTFERERAEAIARLINPCDVFWDVGAHRGYMTLIAARSVGSSGNVFAFEPASANRAMLERHIAWNRLQNVQVFPYALSDRDGEENFGGKSSLSMHICEDGAERVTLRSVPSLLDIERLPSPTFLKIDAEGAEVDILTSALGAIDLQTSLVLVSTHSLQLHNACQVLLEERGLHTFEAGSVNQAREQGWEALGDVELLAVGQARAIDDEQIAAFRMS